MTKYALVDDATSDVIKVVEGDKEFRTGTPPDLPLKPITWYPHVRDPNPIFDDMIEKLGPVESSLANGTVTARRLKITLDAGERQRRKLIKLSDTDHGMARVTEDIAVAMITGDPVSQAAKDKINVRRRLRGQGDI